MKKIAENDYILIVYKDKRYFKKIEAGEIIFMAQEGPSTIPT